MMYFRLGTRTTCKNCDDTQEVPILTMTIILGEKNYRICRYSSDDYSTAKEIIYVVSNEKEEQLIRTLENVGQIRVLTDEQVKKAIEAKDDFVIVNIEDYNVPWEQIKDQLSVIGIVKED